MVRRVSFVAWCCVHMTDSTRFVYQVVVPKSLAPKELVKVFESGEKIVLPPWDPMVCSIDFTEIVILIVMVRAHLLNCLPC